MSVCVYVCGCPCMSECALLFFLAWHEGGCLAAAQMTLRVFLMFWYLLLWWCFSFNCVFKVIFILFFSRGGLLFWVGLFITQCLCVANEKSRHYYCNISFSFLASSWLLFPIIFCWISPEQKTLKITNFRQPLV